MEEMVESGGWTEYLRTDQPHPPDGDGRVLQQGLGGVWPGARGSQDERIGITIIRRIR